MKRASYNENKKPLIKESIDEDLQEPLPLSTIQGQEENRPKIKIERVKERKTYTAKKKIFTQKENKMPQPQASEDINQDKIVVKGLKSKKDNREFKFVENDISIIDVEDVISYFLNAVLNKQKDTVILPFEVEVFECK
ncbi:unnamed protein product [Parnassius apollo]|uniref:(apollo) hypothetical protein n=1 Tax=Parnassius apollo TaxID=110799 RepID=A0A8S3WLY5_PARAO|nr:unnamed protein product [Parnassius apollo]